MSWRDRLKGGQIAAANRAHRRSYADGYRAALADVRREIDDRWGAASFSSYRARVIEVLDQLEQRGTTTTEKNDAR